MHLAMISDRATPGEESSPRSEGSV